MLQFLQGRAYDGFIVRRAGGIVENFGDLSDRALPVREFPDERCSVIEPMGFLRPLVVDHQFLADLLSEELIFA